VRRTTVLHSRSYHIGPNNEFHRYSWTKAQLDLASAAVFESTVNMNGEVQRKIPTFLAWVWTFESPSAFQFSSTLVLFYYPAPGSGTGCWFRAISLFVCLFVCLFLCQQHFEKTAGPICMKFSGNVWSDHGTTWFNFGSTLPSDWECNAIGVSGLSVRGSTGRGLLCLAPQLVVLLLLHAWQKFNNDDDDGGTGDDDDDDDDDDQLLDQSINF